MKYVIEKFLRHAKVFYTGQLTSQNRHDLGKSVYKNKIIVEGHYDFDQLIGPVTIIIDDVVSQCFAFSQQLYWPQEDGAFKVTSLDLSKYPEFDDDE